MSTKKLAKELGVLRQRSESSGLKKSVIANQILSYLIVIDFESTCWREKSNKSQEIIEFPAVLLNTSTGEVESEFHAYVQPHEHPILSAFCTELTGITQAQVEAGIPIHICLSRFNRWLQTLQLQMGVVFSREQTGSQKQCAFLTWSDWDLGVCLQYECKRKQLHKPDVLNSWIDLRSTYRMFYNRKPKGLNGALQDLGIQFSGREHSGLDDARNTAQLAARMMRDGCVMRITRTLNKTTLMAKPTSRNTTCQADDRKEKPNIEEDEQRRTTIETSSKIPLQSVRTKSCSENNTKLSETKENLAPIQTCQSLILPKTLLSGPAKPQWGSSSSRSVTNLSSLAMRNCLSSHTNSNSLVLCSTAVDFVSRLPQPSRQSKASATVGVTEEEEGEEIFVETEERCGSYDDVVLDDDVISELYTERRESDSGSWSEVTLRSMYNRTFNDENRSKTHIMQHESSKSMNNKQSCAYTSDLLNKMRFQSTISATECLLVPNTVTFNCRASDRRHTVGLGKASLKLQHEPSSLSKTFNMSAPFKPKPFVPEKTSTPNNLFVKPKSVITQHINSSYPKQQNKIGKPSFTIYPDPVKQVIGHSLCPPKSVLSSSSANTRSLAMNQTSIPQLWRGGGKVTAPLCACGRRAKRQVVANGGPNNGRGFYCCPVRRSGSGTKIKKGCEFFKWESALMNVSPVPPAVRSSVSLCQANSSLLCHPPQKSTLRKSW
ncbi:ERI1 exoribonuclease 2 [Genypterus blacodes]|uniref:ERI1 exoribonuclease 2 n=1 Tax=Genypterus blacodes TaxID=154954 RepID=UPI003F75AE5B